MLVFANLARMATELAASALLLALPAAWSSAKPLQDRSRFCIPQGNSWVVQDYAPLVDPAKGTLIEQAVYTGNTLTHVLVKNYNDRYELLYDYKFTPDGKLIALHGYLQRWGLWLAEANLYPNPDGSIPTPQVRYRNDAQGGIIADPEDGPEFVQIFSTVPVYRTTADVPCANLLKEAEKRNATQE